MNPITVVLGERGGGIGTIYKSGEVKTGTPKLTDKIVGWFRATDDKLGGVNRD